MNINFIKILFLSYLFFPQIIQAKKNRKTSEIERFKGYEIRVIRPKFFSKKKNMELGTQGAFILNRTFVQSIKAALLLTYHWSDSLGFELDALYGKDLDTASKKSLDEDFSIKTNVLRIDRYYGFNLLWTPVYGKYQLFSGGVVYFDSFLLLGGALAGIDYQYEFCAPPLNDTEAALRQSPQVKHYPGIKWGVGQRFFTSKNTSIRWDIRNYYAFNISDSDGACNKNTKELLKLSTNSIAIQFGFSFFI